ncbi:transposase [Mesorhizobium sp. M1340]
MTVRSVSAAGIRGDIGRQPRSASSRCCTSWGQILNYHPHLHRIVPGGVPFIVHADYPRREEGGLTRADPPSVRLSA